jgi:hypothetical protein
MAANPDPEGQGLLAQWPHLPGAGWLGALQQAARRPEVPAREIVLVVHGTYANPRYPEHPTASSWWSPRGSFGQLLDAALARRGSAARCDLPFDEWLRIGTRDQLRPRWYGWSGANSEVERRRGAFDLARVLRDCQADPRIGKIHLVAHSHGGNVVRRALRYLKNPSAKLGEVICLGTPFLHFDDGAAWRRWLARVHWPMLGVVAAIGSGLYWGADWFNDPANQLPTLAIGAALVAAGVSMWRYARRSEGNAQDVPMTALRFANDEAIQLLRSCAALTAQPHLFLRDMLGGRAPPAQRRRRPDARARLLDDWYDKVWAAAESVWRAAANAGAMLSDLWNGPLCRAGEWLTSQAYRVWLVGALLGNLCTLALLMAFRPYRPPLRPFLASRMPRLRDQFFHSIDEVFARQRDEILGQQWPAASHPVPFAEPDPALRSASRRGPLHRVTDFLDKEVIQLETVHSLVALGPVLLYGLLFYPLDLLLGLPAWLGAVMTRFSILLGARAAAGGATGMDILGAAFQPRRTGEAPGRVTEVIVDPEVERQLEQRLDAAVRVNLAPLRTALDPARSAMLLEALKTVFVDPAMLHVHYYQEAHIVDLVADLIAGRPPDGAAGRAPPGPAPAAPRSPAREPD